MPPELHYFPPKGKCHEPHIERWDNAAVDLTALTQMSRKEHGLVFGTDYEQENIKIAAKALGMEPHEVRQKLEKGEIIKW